ncbi:hypothetical protein [Neochlamydia sp. AcF84]|uniref:hypothetical protein n=1 Tax=Neochlamydia sp. AcF84 TaxID=2315858 RepID=UPI001408B733|nr:hypothetical protein [Neochlamydia sp. AcF84]
MKKRDLKKLALLGLAGGMMLSQSVHAQQPSSRTYLTLLAAVSTPGKSSPPSAPSTATTQAEVDPNAGNLGYHLMDEEELLLELNEEGQQNYQALDVANKKLAQQVASARCGNTNQCKGLNACKTDKHECAGQGSCKGQGKCAIADKNLAVKLVYDKMMKKRALANGN